MTTQVRSTYPLWLEQELRSNHAGEVGAVWIYQGILAARPTPAIRRFCQSHLATERRHLAELSDLLSYKDRSLLLPLWRVAGFLTGFLPGCLNERAVYLTIAAVETFVQQHYQRQIKNEGLQTYPNIKKVLISCMEDEVMHKNEAAELASSPARGIAAGWCKLIGIGSRMAVNLAKTL